MKSLLNKFPGSRLGSLGLKVSAKSPAILMGAGVVGFIGTIVLASKATLKVSADVVPEHQIKMRLIKDNLDKSIKKPESNDEYNVKDYNHDRVVILAQTTTSVAKVYMPTILVGSGTLACFFGAYNILQSRNAALAAAYSLVHTAFSEYRGRVKDELGDVYDQHFRYGTPIRKELVEITDDETGKKKKVEKVVLEDSYLPNTSMYARLFAEYEFDPETGGYTGTRMFMNNHEYNYLALLNAQNRMNDRLRVNGFVFLNDVYDYLGLTRTRAGQVVGWLYKGEDDEGINFMETVDIKSYANGDPILLDFNVQGTILNEFDDYAD